MTGAEELRLHVRFDEGEGPVVVLLHGINSDAESWRTVIDTIGPDYRVIAPDLLGFGNSPKPDIDYTADQHAAALAGTLDGLGLRDRFLLVGYSMGGNVAIRYAATHPGRLRRLFLLSTPFYLPPEAYSRASLGWNYVQARFFQWLWRFIGRQKERNTPIYALASGPLKGPASSFFRTDDVAAYWDRLQGNLTNTISGATFVDDLAHLSMPTVFALGVLDPIVRPDQTMALRRLKPDLEVRRIVGLSADHMLVAKAPATVAREILRDEARKLYVRFRGGTGDPILLLPGLEDGLPWQVVAERLAEHNEVAVVDPLGFGRSPRPLSGHYTLDDHAAAVAATAGDLFGDTPVTMVGHGFGATVALAVAALAPTRVTEVVAFSPALLAPNTAGQAQVANPEVARVLAAREAYADLARDEHAQRRSSERLEADVVPALRSLDAILATDAEVLLARQGGPVRLVLPTDDPVTPRAWLVERPLEQTGLSVVEVDGDERFPYQDPDAAVAVITGRGLASGAASPESRKPGPTQRSPRALADRLLGGANAQLVRYGAVSLFAGLLLLLLPLPIRLLVLGFAAWLLLGAVQGIAGAVGLRRQGVGWLGWALIGAVSLLFAGLVAVQEVFALGVFSLVLAGWALVRGAAALFTAWRALRLPGRRVWLVVEGVLAVAVGVLLLTVPGLGAHLLRWVIGTYLVASGVGSLTIAYAVHRRTLARIRAYVEAA